MRRFFMAFALVITIISIANTSNAEMWYAVCDEESRINVRHEPNRHSEVIGYLCNGESVDVISIRNGWAYVNCAFEYSTGYVKVDFISANEPIEQTEMVVVSNGRVRIRTSANGKPTGKYYANGDTVVVTAVKDGFGRTEKGWVSLDYLKGVD